MFNQKLRMNIAIIPALLIMTSCGTQTSVGIRPTPAPNASVTSTANAGDLGTLTFSKVTDDKVAQYNGMISQNVAKSNAQNPSTDSAPSGGANSSAPMVAAVGSARADGARLASPISYFPTPGAFEEYTVVNFEEAKTKGFSGTYLQALNQIVKPIIIALGSDARLVNSSGSSDANGVNITNPTPSPSNGKDIGIYQPYYNNYQWQFTYASSSKKEVYNISISSQETLVLKQTWGLKDLNPADIKIDSKDAINVITKAIINKSFVSPDANTNSTDYYNPQQETLYEIPKNTNWYLYLEKENGNLIWNINLNINYDNNYPIAYAASPPSYGVSDSVGVSTSVTTVNSSSSPIPAGSPSISPTTMPTSVPYPVYSYPPTPEYWYSGGYARIDATTGKILSLVRPSRYKNVIYPPTPYASAYPVPVQIDSQSGGSATVKN
ncbi:MAG: hypothetical protein H7263_17300 [Candidatus Sericytochromatia bacterium]|nr:hypothetical protein [Candidatus Sericytochromatia bacterium]